MPHLTQIRLAPTERQDYPFSVPAVRALAGGELSLDSDVTILVGENGSGKSTILEAIACAAGAITVGSADASDDLTLSALRPLADAMTLAWRRRSRRGFFMRSEDFFGFVKRVRQIREGLERDLAQVDVDFAHASEHARSLARMPHLRELAALRQRYGEDLDSASHGESYVTLFKARFVPDGLYLLDEPEAPLSPVRQVAFLSMVRGLVTNHGAQFIIATHSPILMAYPGATIYLFDDGAPRQAAYEYLEHVQLTRLFLASPERFLRQI